MVVRRRIRPSLFIGVLGCCTAVVGSSGCTGTIDHVAGPPTDDDNAGGSGAAGAGGRGGSAVNRPPVEPVHGVDLACNSRGINPGPSPLRRLTNDQFVNTMNDLFAGILPAATFELPEENVVGGYSNNAAGQTASPALLEALHKIAKQRAQDATSTANLQKVAACASAANQQSCGQEFIARWARKIYRRPPTREESGRLTALFESSRTSDGYQAAVSDTLQALLSSPAFLYRLEVDGTAEAGAVALDHHQVASRLSYLMWDTLPDAELAASADSGKLATVADIERHVDRLLADQRARPVIARFQRQWLMLDKAEALDKSTATFPKWSASVAQSLRTSVEKYVDHVFWNQGNLSALLTDTHAFVDKNTGWIVGVADAQTSPQLVELNSAQRSGILTQPAVMAAFAKPMTDSATFRGLFVMRQMLCQETGEPPPGVSTTIPAPAPGSAPVTTRQQQERSHAAPTCAACHKRIDGIGFAFSHYDAVGAWRDQDNGLPVDASGEMVGTRDLNGPFRGAKELGTKLAGSAQVKQCVASHWFRWSFGRTETDADSCALLPIVNEFVSSKGDFKKLLKAIATSDAFRYRQGV